MSTVVEPKDKRYIEFANRFQAACDAHPLVPPMRAGRFPYLQSTLKNRFGLDFDVEAIRRWHNGVNIPRRPAMNALSVILDVDEAYLALGSRGNPTPSQARARNARANGATNVVVGFLQMNGGSCAFPSDTDPNKSFVDFYVIVEGQQRLISVTMVHGMGDEEGELSFVSEYERCSNIVAIQSSPVTVELYLIPTSVIRAVGVARGSNVSVRAKRVGTSLIIGSEKFPRLMDLVGSIILDS